MGVDLRDYHNTLVRQSQLYNLNTSWHERFGVLVEVVVKQAKPEMTATLMASKKNKRWMEQPLESVWVCLFESLVHDQTN